MLTQLMLLRFHGRLGEGTLMHVSPVGQLVMGEAVGHGERSRARQPCIEPWLCASSVTSSKLVFVLSVFLFFKSLCLTFFICEVEIGVGPILLGIL